MSYLVRWKKRGCFILYVVCCSRTSQPHISNIRVREPFTTNCHLPFWLKLASIIYVNIYIYTYIICFIYYKQIIEGSLEVKLPTIWTDEKQRWKGSERRERLYRREKSRRERVRRKKMQMREKVGKSRNTVFFQWFVAPEGRKVGSLKRRVRSQLAKWEMKNCTPLWREARFQVKMYKTHHVRTTFGNWDVEKAHTVVARSRSRSQNVQNTPASDHFY